MDTEKEAERIYEEGKAFIKQARDWSDEHMDSLREVVNKASSSLAVILTTQALEVPPLLLLSEACRHLMKASFQIGYYCGRTYEDVPPVFKEEIEK